MELRVLNYFVETARQKSMTKAANKLHITQPTLSKQIKDLEDELGQKLFTRSNYSVNLTLEGEILYKRAIDIMTIVEKTKSEFKSMKDFNGGDLHIGCAESHGITIIADTVKKLKEQYENIRFHLYSGNFQTVTQKMENGLLDFAVTVQEVDTSSFNSLTLPHKDRWGLLTRKDDELAARSTIQISELANLPLIVSRQGFSDEMPNELKDMSQKLNIVGTYDLLFNASIFVGQSLGYAISFDELTDTSDDSELTFIPLSPQITSPMKIIWAINQKLSQTAQLFLQELQKNLE